MFDYSCLPRFCFWVTSTPSISVSLLFSALSMLLPFFFSGCYYCTFPPFLFFSFSSCEKRLSFWYFPHLMVAVHHFVSCLPEILGVFGLGLTIPTRSRYLPELSRSLLPLRDRFLYRVSLVLVRIWEDWLPHLKGSIIARAVSERFPWRGESSSFSSSDPTTLEKTMLVPDCTLSNLLGGGGSPTRSEAGLSKRGLCDHSLLSYTSPRYSCSQHTSQL